MAGKKLSLAGFQAMLFFFLEVNGNGMKKMTTEEKEREREL